LNFIKCHFSYLLPNSRKYLNRKEDKLIEKDESTYIAQIGKKSELREVMDAHERSVSLGYQINDTETITLQDRLKPGFQLDDAEAVTFQDRIKLGQEEKQTGWLKAMDGIRLALDAAGNTGQFIRYANMKIEQHNGEIKKIKKLHEKFDEEVEMLQSQKLEKIIPDEDALVTMDVHTITSMLNQLLLGKRNSKSKLKKLEDDCSFVERELEHQELQIEDVRQLIKEFQYQKNSSSHNANEINAVKTIKYELHYLSRDNDVDKLSNAIDVLTSSLYAKY